MLISRRNLLGLNGDAAVEFIERKQTAVAQRVFLR